MELHLIELWENRHVIRLFVVIKGREGGTLGDQKGWDQHKEYLRYAKPGENNTERSLLALLEPVISSSQEETLMGLGHRQVKEAEEAPTTEDAVCKRCSRRGLRCRLFCSCSCRRCCIRLIAKRRRRFQASALVEKVWSMLQARPGWPSGTERPLGWEDLPQEQKCEAENSPSWS